MISKFLTDKTFGNLKYLSAEEKHSIVCDFGDKLYWKSVGNCAGLLRFLQELRIICIDDS